MSKTTHCQQRRRKRSITQKSVGLLIDELFTTLMKCWNAQEIVCKSADKDEVFKAAKDAQSLNARRNQLIRAIDEELGQGNITPTAKSYAKDSLRPPRKNR